MIKKNLIVFGTRPEAIKMSSLAKEFLENPPEENKIILDFAGVTTRHNN